MERFYKVLLRVDTPGESPFRYTSGELSTKEGALSVTQCMIVDALLRKEGTTVIQVREYSGEDSWDEIRKITINASGREGM